MWTNLFRSVSGDSDNTYLKSQYLYFSNLYFTCSNISTLINAIQSYPEKNMWKSMEFIYIHLLFNFTNSINPVMCPRVENGRRVWYAPRSIGWGVQSGDVGQGVIRQSHIHDAQPTPWGTKIKAVRRSANTQRFASALHVSWASKVTNIPHRQRGAQISQKAFSTPHIRYTFAGHALGTR